MLRNDLAPSIALDGIWEFRLGTDQPWGAIQVPGCWEAQGYSKWVEGPAFYRRSVEVPAAWVGRRILLEFDAVSYHCTIRMNGRAAGSHRGMWTPFAVDVTDHLTAGVNQLEIEIYKPGVRFPLRSTLAGFLPDVAVVFGGLWQGVRLRVVDAALAELQVLADPDAGVIRVSGAARSFGTNQPDQVRVRISLAGEFVGEQPLTPAADGSWTAAVPLPDARLWSPNHPNLYDVAVELCAGSRLLARASERTGFRRLSAANDQLLLNDQPICVRGVLHWGWEPDAIAPAFTDEHIRREFRAIRELGFNLVKLCLFIPNRRYYEIADEEGVLLWQEWPLWLPEITPDLRAIIADEYAAYMRMAAHHPAIVLYSLGCELNDAADAELLIPLDAIVRGAAPAALVCDNSGSSEAFGGAVVDLADFYDYHTYTDLHFFEPMLDHWRRDWRPPRPWIFGEFNDTDSYRDLNAIIAANDRERPWWLTEDIPVHTWRPEVRALLDQLRLIEEADLGFSSQELTTISRAQSHVVLKYVLEAVRRRAGMGGYVVIGIRDTPIVTSGVLDDFGNAKWPPPEVRRFNDDAVLCLEVDRRRSWEVRGDRPERLDVHNWWSGSTAHFHFVLHNAGEVLTPAAQFEWRLEDAAGEPHIGGSCPLPPNGWPSRPQEVASVAPALPIVTRPVEFRLVASIRDGARSIENQWPLWVYPEPSLGSVPLAIYDPSFCLSEWQELLDHGHRVSLEQVEDLPRVVVATALAPRLIDYLRTGGNVILIQQGDGPLPVRRVPFWRESIKLFYAHPIWTRFPHRGYADLQFFGLATDVAFETKEIARVLPEVQAVRPLMRRLDAREFHVTDYAIEVDLGKGRLLASTLRFQGGAGAQPSGLRRNVAGTYLLWETVRHLAGAWQTGD